MENIKYELKNTPDAEEQKVIRDGIVTFNQSIINDKHTCFNICVKHKENIIAGGIFTNIKMLCISMYYGAWNNIDINE